ncbi:hypothetical protein BH09BAC1_BH09BAC1_25310 [soil metagenome]
MMVTGSDIAPVVRLADASYQPAGTADNTFLINIGLDCVSYAVLEEVSNTVVAYASHPLTSEDRTNEAIRILGAEDWALENFHQVRVVVQPNNYVLIPKDLFDPREIATYLRFNSFDEPEDSLHFDRMDTLDLVGVYHLPYWVLSALNKQFQSPLVFAAPTPFIQLATREHKNEKSDQMLVLFTFETMHLVVIQNGKFIFYNSFTITAKEDVSYYSLAVCEQVHLSPEKIAVHIWGEGEHFASQASTLQYYFRNVKGGIRPKALKYADALQPLTLSAQYPLFATALCE